MHVPDPHGGHRLRTSDRWPPLDTTWTELHLHPADGALAINPPESDDDVSFAADGDGLTFTTAPMTRDTDVVGPMAARLHVSTTGHDADLFLTVRVLDPDGVEVTFIGAIASEQVLTNGWLRLSQRKTDPARSLRWRPWHTHDEILPVEPGRIYPIDVEIWPTGIHLPAGHILTLTIGATDYTRPDQHPAAATLFLHTDPHDRPTDLRATTITLHVGPAHDNTLLIPTSMS